MKFEKELFDFPVCYRARDGLRVVRFLSSTVPVQENLRWGCDRETADRICNFNRHYAEHSGYFSSKTDFVKYARSQEGEISRSLARIHSPFELLMS